MLIALVVLALSFFVIFLISIFQLSWDFGGKLYSDFPDRAIWLGVAFRVFSGQLPHIDFVSTMGPGMPLFYGWAMKIFGPYTSSFPPITALTILSYVGVTGFLNYKRWPIELTAALALLAITHLAMPFLNYNYLGFYFLFCSILEYFTFQNATSYRNSSWSFGVLAAFVLFSKYIFFAFSGILFLLALTKARPTRQWLIGASCSFFVTFILFAFFFNFEFATFFHDISISRKIRGDLVVKEFLDLKIHKRFFHKYIWGILLFFGMHLLFKLKFLKQKVTLVDFLIPVVFFIVQNAVILSCSNWPWPYAKEWMAGFALAQISLSPKVEVKPFFVSFIVLAMLAWSSLSFYEKIIRNSEKAWALKNYADRTNCVPIPSYTCAFEDGLELLGKNQIQDKLLLSLTYEDPFNVYFNRPGIKGDLTHWSHTDSVSEQHHPDVAKLLGQVSFVLEPKQFASDFHLEAYRLKQKIFYPEVQRTFKIMDQNRSWVLWQKAVTQEKN